MIKEAYVSFEVAKLLKEKGFNERTLCYYISNGEIRESMCPAPWNNGVTEPLMICAATQQMAMRWLRENYKLHFVIAYNQEYEVSIMTIEDNPRCKCRSIVKNFYEEAVETALKYALENLI